MYSSMGRTHEWAHMVICNVAYLHYDMLAPSYCHCGVMPDLRICPPVFVDIRWLAILLHVSWYSADRQHYKVFNFKGASPVGQHFVFICRWYPQGWMAQWIVFCCICRSGWHSQSLSHNHWSYHPESVFGSWPVYQRDKHTKQPTWQASPANQTTSATRQQTHQPVNQTLVSQQASQATTVGRRCWQRWRGLHN